MGKPHFSFGRAQRVLLAKDFENLKAAPYKIESKLFLLKATHTPVRPEATEGDVMALPRMGVIASRKVGPSVVRNKAKRRCREGFRLLQSGLPQGIDVLLIARARLKTASFNDFMAELAKVFAKVQKDWSGKAQ
jgi:ribonuclease P protein component